MTDETKPVARARKPTSTRAAVAKKPAARKKSATASLAEARFAPAPKSAPRKSAGKKAAAKKSAPRKTARKAPVKKVLADGSKPARKLLKPDVGSARRKPSSADSDAHALLQKTIMDALDRLKGKDIVALDVRDKTSMTDLIVIATGTSSRHVKGLAEEVVKSSKQIGQVPLGVEGAREGEWVLVDLGDAIIHLMLPRSREFYGLERLWTVGDPEPADALEGEAGL